MTRPGMTERLARLEAIMAIGLHRGEIGQIGR